tara:strand:- start:1248 stop:2432 length:1185 start_codon:yes stop_codon:yes gene_type:complete
MNKIIQGDCLEKLKELPDESVDCVMTSPPYWALRDYGTATWEGGKEDCNHQIPKTELDPKYPQGTSHNIRFNREKCYKCGAKRIDQQLGLEPTFQEYINKLCDIFDEVKRVLKKTGTCWVNLGDTYYGNSSYSNEGRAGFNQKDGNTKEWSRQFGEGKCLVCGKTTEKQFCSTECLNKKGNDFRSQNRQLKDKCLVQIPQRFSIEMVNRGWILRNTIIWKKNNCMPCSVKDRFTVDFEYIFFFVKNKKYWFEQQREPVKESSIERSKHSWDCNRANNRSGVHTEQKGNRFVDPEGRNKRAVWTINPKPFSAAHFAVYPEELCETPIKSGCPEGGVVLDPFFGSGTTGVVAKRLKRNYLGIELNPEYIKIAEMRLKGAENWQMKEAELNKKLGDY